MLNKLLPKMERSEILVTDKGKLALRMFRGQEIREYAYEMSDDIDRVGTDILCWLAQEGEFSACPAARKLGVCSFGDNVKVVDFILGIEEARKREDKIGELAKDLGSCEYIIALSIAMRLAGVGCGYTGDNGWANYIVSNVNSIKSALPPDELMSYLEVDEEEFPMRLSNISGNLLDIAMSELSD